MKITTFTIRCLAGAGFVLLFLACIVSTLDSRREVAKARSQYEQAHSSVEKTEESLREVEQRLLRLSTDIDAVEDEVRRQLRMIRPGEELILIEYVD